MTGQQINPSRWLYVIAAAIIVVGTVFFVIFLFSSLQNIAGNLTQVVVPGTKALEFTEPGDYTIFYEYKSVIGNKIYATGDDLSGLECNLVEKATGRSIALAPTTTNMTYSTGGRAGMAIFNFTIEKPGTYELSAIYIEHRTGPEVVLAVGKGFMVKLMTTIFGGIAILFVSIIAGAAITIITFVKRYQAKKRLTASPQSE